jgi:hypothetical protein
LAPTRSYLREGGGGMKVATIRDVAERAEVNPSPGSRVSTVPVTEATEPGARSRRGAAVCAPPGARSLSTSKTQTIA